MARAKDEEAGIGCSGVEESTSLPDTLLFVHCDHDGGLVNVYDSDREGQVEENKNHFDIDPRRIFSDDAVGSKIASAGEALCRSYPLDRLRIVCNIHRDPSMHLARGDLHHTYPQSRRYLAVCVSLVHFVRVQILTQMTTIVEQPVELMLQRSFPPYHCRSSYHCRLDRH